MTPARLLLAGLAALAMLAGGPRVPLAAAAAGANFRVEKLAPGVYAVIRREPLGLANHANDVFLIGRRDVIVIDDAFTLEATQEVLSALRRLTRKPVRCVINTHWHDDHTFGNQVYRDAFPGVEFIAQANTRADMESTGVENRRRQVAGAPQALAALREADSTNVSLQGGPLAADERAAYVSTEHIVAQYLADMPRFRLTLPTRTFEDSLMLEQDGRVIEVRCFGPGNTRGDAIVWLPAERVLVAGDLVNVPIPTTAGSHPGGWIATLDRLRALAPRTIVPGHGPVLHGPGSLDLLEHALKSARAQADSAVPRGQTLEEFRKSFDLEAFRVAMAGDRRMLEFFFDGWFKAPLAGAAFAEAAARR